jgi:signal transduction histidine kinase
MAAQGDRAVKRAVRKRDDSTAGCADPDEREIVSFVAHELSNSMGSLLLNVSVLAEGAAGPLAPEQRRIVVQLLADVTRLRDLVRTHLDLTRRGGGLSAQPEDVEVRGRAIEPVLRRLAEWLSLRGMEMRWDWPADVLVRADPGLLEICYGNLVVNALKYGEGWVRFSAVRDGSDWKLGVANGGTPIPSKKAASIFGKFTRLAEEGEGAGLGLYLVRRIVERHGGTVWCEPLADGTAFFLRLPAAAGR